MAQMVEGLFRRNDTLDNAMGIAMRRHGVGLIDRIRFRIAFNGLSDEDRLAAETGITKILVESGRLPVGAKVENGVVVSSFLDILQLLIDSLPKILEFLAKLLPLFVLL